MSTSFRRVNRSHPCPICEKTDKCRVAPGFEIIEVVECYRLETHLGKKCFKAIDNTVGTAHYHRLTESRATGGAGTCSFKKIQKIKHRAEPEKTGHSCLGAASSVKSGAEEPSAQASMEYRHKVYERLLELCPLSAADKQDNEQRGLDTRRLGYGTLPLPARRRHVVDELETQFGRELLLGVPGFFQDQNGKLGIWSGEGLLVPVRNGEAQIVALRRRNPRPDTAAKWTWVSTGETCQGAIKSPSAGAPVHWARKGEGAIAILTEGERKADVIAAYLGKQPAALAGAAFVECEGKPRSPHENTASKLAQLGDRNTAVISVPGVGSWNASGVVEQLTVRGIDTVRIAYDMDLWENRQVAKAALKLSSGLADAGREVEVVTWDPKHKGLDDALLAGASTDVLKGDRAEEFLCDLAARFDCTRQGEERTDPRPEFAILCDQDDNIRRALTLIENDEFLFMLSGSLVHATSASSCEGALEIDPRHSVQARIRQATPEYLAARLSGLCRPFEWRKSRKGEEQIKIFCSFPVALARQILAVAGTAGYSAPREILGVLEGPTLDGEGNLIHCAGYCKIGGAGWYLAQAVPELKIPENPTKEECKQAERILWEAVQYFPWKEECDYHRWLACLFAPLLRPLYPTCPLLLVTANAPGSGKGYLVSGISFIVHGRDMENTTWPSDTKDKEEELRRSLSNWISGGAAAVCLDNLPDGASLESSTLCSFLTAPIFSCRLLGQNGGARAGGANSLTLYGTGNNIQPGGDLSQRCLLVRLDCPHENPRLRSPDQFGAIGDFSAYCRNRANRVALLQAALTILRGFLCSGEFKRKESCPFWGSFDGFARYVAGAVQWLTGVNPIDNLFTTFNGDRKAGALAATLGRWKERLGVGSSYSARSVAEWVEKGLNCPEIDPDRDWGEFAESLENLGANLGKPRSIGRVLNQYCDRPISLNGVLHRLTSKLDAHGISQFSLVRAEASRLASQTIPGNYPNPPSVERSSGFAGLSGFVSGQPHGQLNGDAHQVGALFSEERKTNPAKPDIPESTAGIGIQGCLDLLSVQADPTVQEARDRESEKTPIEGKLGELFLRMDAVPYDAPARWRPPKWALNEPAGNDSPPEHPPLPCKQGEKEASANASPSLGLHLHD